MGLNFFEKIRLKFKFYKFLKRTNFLKIPFDLNSFEKIIIFLPENNNTFSLLLQKIKNKFKKEIKVFLPEDINYENLKSLNNEIIKNKILLMDFLEDDDFKNFIVPPLLWISNNYFGNLIIKTNVENIFSFIFGND